MYTITTATTCDVTTFAAPPSAGALVSVNGTQLKPSPFVNLNLEKNISDDIIIGGLLRVQLSGMAVGDSFDQVAAGGGVGTSIKEVIELAGNSDCVNVVIQCGSQFINGAGRITSASASEGNQPTWVNMAPYTIEIELYTNNLTGKPYVDAENPESSENPDTKDLMLKDITEQFTITVDEDSFNFGLVAGCNAGTACGVGSRHVKVSFSISATGIRGGSEDCEDPGVEPSSGPSTKYYGLEAVEKYMIRRIDKLKDMDLTGLKNKPNDLIGVLAEYSGGNSYLDFRSLEVDPRANRMNLSGDIIYRPAGCEPDVFTNITVDENVDSEGSQITVAGTITGLVDVDYTKIIRAAKYLDTGCAFNDKMSHAKTYFDKINNEDTIKGIALAHQTRPYIVDSCQLEGDEDNPLESCFPTETSQPPELCDFRLISSQISRDYAEGKIDFSFVVSNKQEGCTVPGVASIEIDGSHDIPHDSIVEVVIPGRGLKGALTQNLCCLSVERWTFNVDLRLLSKGCKIAPKKTAQELRDCAQLLLNKFKTDLGSEADTTCWFVTDKSETISRSSYKYTIQYTKPSCP